jgi:phosphatidylinositol glycan class B
MSRPAFQPFIVYVIAKPLMAAGLYNPFAVAFLVRFLISLFSLWAIIRLVRTLLPSLETSNGQRFFLFTAFFLWYIPFISVRFTSENVSASLFLMAASILLKEPKGKNLLRYLLAGLLFGIAVFVRVQVAFAMVGVAIWVLFVKKMPVKDWAMLVIGGLAGVGLNIVIDKWFYGAWVLTPYRYFDKNLLQGVAANFGKMPWWFYIPEFIKKCVPPISILMFILFIDGARRKPMHFFVLAAIPFLIGHFFIEHKEIRFYFPMAFALSYIASISFDKFVVKYGLKPLSLGVLYCLAAFNVALLAYKTFTPANEAIKYYQFVSEYAKKQPVTIVSLGKSPYYFFSNEANFYKTKNIETKVVNSTEELQALVATNKDRAILFLNTTDAVSAKLEAVKKQKIFSYSIKSSLHFNFMNFLPKPVIWTIFKIEAQ